MAYPASVIPIMLASPGDVCREREIAREVIHDWNYVHSSATKIILMPVGWETHSSPELSGRPQSLINDRVLKDCDLLLGIFWTRLGTPTGDTASGTVEEIQRHLEKGKPVMVYFSTAPVAPQTLDQAQFNALGEFRAWCEGKGLVSTFDHAEDFRQKLGRELRITLQQNPYLESLLNDAAALNERKGGDGSPLVIGELPSAVTLSNEAKELLLEGTLDMNGQILHMMFLGGDVFQTNRKAFGQTDDARVRAAWKYGMEQLEELGFIRSLGDKRQIFEVTHEGFDRADNIRATGRAE